MLVIGGSLGSKEINKAIYSIKDYLKFINLQVVWPCGRLYYDYYLEKSGGIADARAAITN